MAGFGRGNYGRKKEAGLGGASRAPSDGVGDVMSRCGGRALRAYVPARRGGDRKPCHSRLGSTGAATASDINDVGMIQAADVGVGIVGK